jgi:CheY-like chemotaxis protein
VAHDLNNILSGIVSYPDVLLSELPPDSDLVEPLEVIRESGRRAAAVVRDLLTIARGAATTRQVRDVNRIVREYLDSAELDTLRDATPGVVFKAELSDDLLSVMCSPVQIRKVVMNLVTNGAEAITGVGLVTVSTHNRYVDRPLPGHDRVAIGEYVVLSVTDTGTGINDADLERIFEPFYTKKVMGRSGTGLGLAVVWSTVKDHEGFVNVSSGPDGTRVDVYLPASRAALEQDEVARDIAEYQGRGERVLVIDDEPGQRQIAGRMLARLGYQVEAVAGGEEALPALRKRPVDVLVLDMVMPGGWDGRETYERILDERPGQRALIVSGYAETADVRAIQARGGGPFLRKPYTLEALGVALRQVLDAE